MTTLPYENATSGDRAIQDIQKVLRSFGCSRFGTGEDFATGALSVQFEYNGRMVHLKASAKGYAAAWLKAHPYTARTRATRAQHEARALQTGSVAVYSILRDWIKGQITAVEIGMMSFDAAFLAHVLLPDGRRVIEHVQTSHLLEAPSK